MFGTAVSRALPVCARTQSLAGSWCASSTTNNQQSFYTAKVLTSHIPNIHLGRPRTGRARVSLVPSPLLADGRHGCKPCPSRSCSNPISLLVCFVNDQQRLYTDCGELIAKCSLLTSAALNSATNSAGAADFSTLLRPPASSRSTRHITPTISNPNSRAASIA
jgi:hypothetical protein